VTPPVRPQTPATDHHAGDAARRAPACQRRNKVALDSNDRFIVSVVTRGGIAEELNDHLERPEFRPDDDRLTDEV
jgi:hypothetical protein